MENKCKNCVYANRAGSNEHVYCTFWQKKYNDSKSMNMDDFIKKVIYAEPLPKVVAVGWGYPHQSLNQETFWGIKGTSSEGLMWNEQIIISKEDTCSHFKCYQKE